MHQFSDWCIFIFCQPSPSRAKAARAAQGLSRHPARRSARNTPPERQEPRSGPRAEGGGAPPRPHPAASQPPRRGEGRAAAHRHTPARGAQRGSTHRAAAPTETTGAGSEGEARADAAGGRARPRTAKPPAVAQKGRRGIPADREPATAGGAGGAAEASPPERQAPQRGDAAANLVTAGRHPASEPEQPAGGAGRERPKAPPIGGAWSVEGDFVTTATPWLFMRYRA